MSVVVPDLLKRLKQIQAECGVTENKETTTKAPLQQSSFRLTRREISEDLKNIRILIHERDDVAEKDLYNPRIATLSAQVRKQIGEVEKKADSLEELQHAKVKKNVQDDDDETKENAIALIRDLISECKNLEAKRVISAGKAAQSTPTRGRSNSKSKSKVSTKVSMFRESLLGGTEESKPQEMTALSTALEDIDVDTGIQRLDQMEKEQDQDLSEMVSDVRRIKEVVVGINSELDTQGHMIDAIEEDMQENQEHLDRVQTKLRKSIIAARSGSKFTVDIILLVILLGILSYIYSLVQS
ncbi:hypothetical protein GEMRC1_010819 [Eukaryota sp. GEM-RC1]